MTQTPSQKRPGIFALNEANPLVPYLFLVPHAILFFAFVVYPIVYGLYISVFRWDPLNNTQPFVGLEFFTRLFDPSSQQAQFFWPSLLNTTFFVVLTTPLQIAVALGLALQLHRPIFGRSFFRTIFFMPCILSVTVIGVLWRWVFEERNGLVNVFITEVLHGRALQFITTEGLAWIPIIVATIWWGVGFNMTLYLAALTGIPDSYYEAAELDGANPWGKFRFITLPLIAPSTLFILVTTILGNFQLFGQSQLITNGGPTRSTRSIIMYITEEAFSNNQFSSSIAMSLVFGAVMLVFTVMQFRSMARDVQGASR